MKIALFISIFFLSTEFGLAQNKLIKSVDSENIQQVVMDRAGDVYVITTSSILKYDKNGKELNTAGIQSVPTSFDTGNGVRLLMYQRKDQQYTILSPSLEKISETKIETPLPLRPG